MNEESYSAYMKWQSNYSNVWALFSGFTFTAINIILTQFPNLSDIRAQTTLFILTVLLDTFLFQLYTRRYIIENCVRIGPPLPKTFSAATSKTLTFLAEHLSWVLLGVAVLLLFLLWNLVYLAAASGVVGILFVIFAYTAYVKPFEKLFKERPIIRK